MPRQNACVHAQYHSRGDRGTDQRFSGSARMNILLVSTHFNTGGITTYILTLAKGFIQRGHKVIVVSSGGELVEALEKMGGIHFFMNILTKSELDPKIYLTALRLRKM